MQPEPTPCLYVLHEGANASTLDRVDILRSASSRAGIDFFALDSLLADYSRLPKLNPGDMLFNCGRGSTMLETLIARPYVSTFRYGKPKVVTNGRDTTVFSALLENEGFPAPRTIYRLPSDNEVLSDYVDYLGGFPIVIKIVGGTVGVGTMIIESMRSLRSVVDYLRTTGDDFILREFIQPAHVCRLLVLGDQVVASLKYPIREDDFRGQAYRQGGQEMRFGEHVESLAIRASRACEYDFTGVDVLIGEDGSPYILEVNPPSNFVAYEREMGIPIGDMIVRHLLNGRHKTFPNALNAVELLPGS